MSTALLNLLFAQIIFKQLTDLENEEVAHQKEQPPQVSKGGSTSPSARHHLSPSPPAPEFFMKLSQDLKEHPLNSEFNLSPQACQSLYNALLPQNPMRPTGAMLQPLLGKLYESYKKDIITQIRHDEQDYKSKLREIEQIERGKWDTELLKELDIDKAQVQQQQQLKAQRQLELQKKQEQALKIQRQQLQRQQQLELQQLKQQQLKQQQFQQQRRQIQNQRLQHGETDSKNVVTNQPLQRLESHLPSSTVATRSLSPEHATSIQPNISTSNLRSKSESPQPSNALSPAVGTISLEEPTSNHARPVISSLASPSAPISGHVTPALADKALVLEPLPVLPFPTDEIDEKKLNPQEFASKVKESIAEPSELPEIKKSESLNNEEDNEEGTKDVKPITDLQTNIDAGAKEETPETVSETPEVVKVEASILEEAKEVITLDDSSSESPSIKGNESHPEIPEPPVSETSTKYNDSKLKDTGSDQLDNESPPMDVPSSAQSAEPQTVTPDDPTEESTEAISKSEVPERAAENESKVVEVRFSETIRKTRSSKESTREQTDQTELADTTSELELDTLKEDAMEEDAKEESAEAEITKEVDTTKKGTQEEEKEEVEKEEDEKEEVEKQEVEEEKASKGVDTKEVDENDKEKPEEKAEETQNEEPEVLHRTRSSSRVKGKPPASGLKTVVDDLKQEKSDSEKVGSGEGDIAIDRDSDGKADSSKKAATKEEKAITDEKDDEEAEADDEETKSPVAKVEDGIVKEEEVTDDEGEEGEEEEGSKDTKRLGDKRESSRLKKIRSDKAADENTKTKAKGKNIESEPKDEPVKASSVSEAEEDPNEASEDEPEGEENGEEDSEVTPGPPTSRTRAMSSTARVTNKRKRLSSPLRSSGIPNRRFLTMVNPLLSNISSNKSASFFANAVNPNDAPNYYDLIYGPTDIRTIKAQVKDGRIKDTNELERELQRMFANAVMYNGWDSDVSVWTREMQHETETLLALFRGAERTSAVNSGFSSGSYGDKAGSVSDEGQPPETKRRKK